MVFLQNENSSIDSAWSGLTNALSGLFCASLNFIDSTSTVSPAWSFRPEGASSGRFITFDTILLQNTMMPA